MKAIVAVCSDWAIGNSGQLLVKNKADMRAFVQYTTGNTVVMGRRTLDSFPGGRALKNRRNIVLTRDSSFSRDNVEVAHCQEELAQLIQSEEPSRVWVIGGESIYRMLLPLCDEVVVTKNDCIRPADAFFPNLDDDPEWHPHPTGASGTTDEGITWQTISYRRS